MKDFFDRFCASLTQDELNELHHSIWKAEVAKRVEKGEYSKPNPLVIDHIRNGYKIEAIKEYRIQTNCNLLEAKSIVEYWGSLSPDDARLR